MRGGRSQGWRTGTTQSREAELLTGPIALFRLVITFWFCPTAVKSPSQASGQKTFSLGINRYPVRVWLREEWWGSGLDEEATVLSQEVSDTHRTCKGWPHLLWGCSALQLPQLQPTWAKNLTRGIVKPVASFPATKAGIQIIPIGSLS